MRAFVRITRCGVRTFHMAVRCRQRGRLGRGLADTLIVVSAAGLLVSCKDRPEAPAASSSQAAPTAAVPEPVSPNAQRGAALPFRISRTSVSGWQDGGVTVAHVAVTVNGGNAADWAATAIVIAEAVATLPADSVRVTVWRGDVDDLDPPESMKTLAVAFYSPDLSRTIWPDRKWLIQLADGVVSREEIVIANELRELTTRLGRQGLDASAAQKRAFRQIRRKYRLPADWSVPMVSYSGGLSRADFIVDASAAAGSVAALKACLKGDKPVNNEQCP